jgi:hypothetical protein
VVGATSLAGIALLLAYRDDDDWKKREEWDRDQYWWFKVGDAAFRIPKPFEVGALASLAERGVEMMLDGMDADSRKRFGRRFLALVGDNLSMNPIPQAFKPALDIWANYDSFTGRPIESAGMENLTKANRIGDRTSATAQLVGKATGPLLHLSPVQIDQLIQGYFGWLGSHAVMTADLALRPAMGLPGKPAMKVGDIFTVGDFVKDLPSQQSRFVTEFYDQAQNVQQAFADYRNALATGQTQKALELMQDNRDLITLHPLYQHSATAITKINQQLRRLQMNRELSAEDKRAQIDALIARKQQYAENAVSARKRIEAGR